MWRQASVLTVLLLVSASLMPTRAQQPAAVPVGTVAAELRPITQSTEFVGRVEAIDRVDVRARVTGFLQKMLFKEGDMVKEGQALYEIEPDTYKAAEMQARGALIQAQAKFANATAQRPGRKSWSRPTPPRKQRSISGSPRRKAPKATSCPPTRI